MADQNGTDGRRIAKPFLKWAGGKTQLMGAIERIFPAFISQGSFTYVEPFVGSGAVLFRMLSQFPNLQKAVINDVNSDLINTYKIIASHPEELIQILESLQRDFHALEENEEGKKQYYYQKRADYNARNKQPVLQAALFIFLNRTCFNGLYRVNRKNEYNVPMGSYKTPTICDAQNLRAVSRALKGVEICCGDFEKTLEHVDGHALFYLDPPYKPLSQTSGFNAYMQDNFDDREQIRLRDFCNRLHSLGHTWILSNSDVKGTDENNDFFDDLYAGYTIRRVAARRNINSKADKRGALTELLITNTAAAI